MSEDRTLAHDSIYIDPASCDSQISYKINLQTYKGKQNLNASVLLSDCSRRIDWYFGHEESSLAKLDKAIKFLNTFRRKLKAEINNLGG